MATYGDPYGSWGYDKFLTGANDKSGKFTQFAPKLVSDGGAWDPDAWAQMFFDAGARFAGPVAEHHDGFSMWDSKVNEWNSVAMGPKLNLAKLHADAIRKKGLKLFMSLHHEWNFGGYWAYGTPTTSDPSLQKLYGKLPNATEQTLWLNKLKEVIDEFLPDILYQDRYLSGISQANLMAFLAYYYNAALDANVDVVAVAKETITDHKGQLYDYERGGPADIRTPYWMTDDSVGSQSWCYVTGLSYYTDAQFIGSFVDRVSKGGNMILNISPMPDGTYPAAAERHSGGVRKVPQADGHGDLQHPSVGGVRRRPDQDGRRRVHLADGPDVERHSLHEIEGRRCRLRDSRWLAGQRQSK